MNIFIFDLDIKKNVSGYCDEHIRKMPIETAQMLSYAHHLFPNPRNLSYSPIIMAYSQARANHPCSKWVRESMANYNYLVELGEELCKEFEKRFGHKIKSEEVINWCSDHFIPLLPEISITPFPQCMPDQYKVKTGDFKGDIVKAYRNYFLGEKIGWATWNRGDIIPDWISEEIRLEKQIQRKNWEEKQRIDSIKIRVGSEIILNSDFIDFNENIPTHKITKYPSNNMIEIDNLGIIGKSEIKEVIKY